VGGEFTFAGDLVFVIVLIGGTAWLSQRFAGPSEPPSVDRGNRVVNGLAGRSLILRLRLFAPSWFAEGFRRRADCRNLLDYSFSFSFWNHGGRPCDPGAQGNLKVSLPLTKAQSSQRNPLVPWCLCERSFILCEQYLLSCVWMLAKNPGDSRPGIFEVSVR
jgi:hypothetical protein